MKERSNSISALTIMKPSKVSKKCYVAGSSIYLLINRRGKVNKKVKKIIALAMISIMLLTVFGASSSIAQRKTMAPQETITVTVVNVSGAPIENSKVFIGGGHQDPLTIVLDTEITDENGQCEFTFPAGIYTLYVLGPDENGIAVSGLGAAFRSAYLPNLRFISVIEGGNYNLTFTLIKRPKFWSLATTPFVQEI